MNLRTDALTGKYQKATSVLQGYNLDIHIYNDLAWGGLTHFDHNGDGQSELSKWFKEAFPNTTDRHRITNIIKNEQKGYSNAKGTDAGC